MARRRRRGVHRPETARVRESPNPGNPPRGDPGAVPGEHIRSLPAPESPAGENIRHDARRSGRQLLYIASLVRAHSWSGLSALLAIADPVLGRSARITAEAKTRAESPLQAQESMSLCICDRSLGQRENAPASLPLPRDGNDRQGPLPCPHDQATGRRTEASRARRRLRVAGARRGESPGFLPPFLDDIDKLKPTDFKTEILFDLLDTLYRRKHALTVTGNHSFSDPVDRERMHPAIVRRLDGMCRVAEV
jgi:hypothetical protein